MAMPERSPVTGQVGVVLARSVEQDVQAGQAGRQHHEDRGAGVVDAVRQQPRPGVVGRDPPQLSTCHPKRKRQVREACRDPKMRVLQPGGGTVLAEVS